MEISLKPIRTFWAGWAMAVCWAAGFGTVPTRADSPPPQNTTDPVLDLGKVGRGWSGDLTWTLSNPGPRPMAILGVEPGCHCVEPKIDAALIESGGQTRVRARIRTLSQPEGPVVWKVKVRHRMGDEIGETSFWAKAELIADLICQPTIVAFRGHGSATVPVTLTDRRKPGLEVLKVSSGVKGVQAHLVQSQAGQCQIRIEKLPGNHGVARGFVVLETNDPVYPSIEIPTQIETAHSQTVESTPAQIRLNPPGQARVVLSRPGDLLVRVAKVQTPAGLSARIIRGPGPKTTLEFLRSGPVAAGEKVTVAFENTQLPTLEIPIELESESP